MTTDWNGLITRWADVLRGEGRHDSGIESYCWSMQRFVRWLGADADATAITKQVVKQYQTGLGAQRLNPGTIGNRLTVIRCFCNYLVDEGVLATNPTTGLKWPKLDEVAPRALKQEELTLLWDILQRSAMGTAGQQWTMARNQRAMALMLLAGLRISEVAALVWRDVERDGDKPMLEIRNAKGGKDRSVPIGEALLPFLQAAPSHAVSSAVAGRPDGKRMSPKSLAHLFERWLPTLGLDITAHQLRHSFATELLLDDVDVRTIQRLLGHKSLDTTMRYLAVDDERKRNAVNRLKGW